MTFTKRSVEKFQRLFLNRFGEELSDEQARQKAEQLLELYRVVYESPD